MKCGLARQKAIYEAPLKTIVSFTKLRLDMLCFYGAQCWAMNRVNEQKMEDGNRRGEDVKVDVLIYQYEQDKKM